MLSKNSKAFTFILIFSLFLFRTLFGLSSEFWFDDELQIYLIGLKAYTTNSWPFYGPDVVYTHTQIPGALQGLLIALPLYILPIPESPIVFLNILSMASLIWLSFYLNRLLPHFTLNFLICWTSLLVWPMMYGTRVVNPSYVFVFSIPFFIAFFESLPHVRTNYLKQWQAYLIMGICITLLAQLHLSYVLLLGLCGVLLLFDWISKTSLKSKMVHLISIFAGLILGATTLIPTLINGKQANAVTTALQINWENFTNAPIILIRYLFFSSFEISYILGGNNEQRKAFLLDQPYSAPFTILLFITGFLLILLMLFFLITKSENPTQKELKIWFFISYFLVFLSFFFSVKGPSSHTFYVLFPFSMVISFFSINWLTAKKPFLARYLRLVVPVLIVFYTFLGIYQFKTRSLYINRDKIVQSIDKKDYTILGIRRY